MAKTGKVFTYNNGCVQVFDINLKRFVKNSMPNILEAVENESWGHRDSLEHRSRKDIIKNYSIIAKAEQEKQNNE